MAQQSPQEYISKGVRPVGTRFELFRLSLLPNPNPGLFPVPEQEVTREAYLRARLGTSIEFTSFKRPYHFVPQRISGDGYIIGRVGRKFRSRENAPPEQGLHEVIRDSWHAALIIIDPSHHEDGQKVAVEVDPEVGTPSALLSYLVTHLNGRLPPVPYIIEFEKITSEQSFWVFADKHRGNVMSITFDLIPPNMFGSSDELSDELRKFRKDIGITRLGMKLKSPSGLNTDSVQVRSAVEHVAKGGGKVRAKARTGEIYDSQKQVASTMLDMSETETAANKVESLSGSRDLVDRALGRLRRTLLG